MKKALMNASVASMIYKFNMENVALLQELGYEVHVACNFGKENPITPEQIETFRKLLRERGVTVHETDCPRNPLAFGQMAKTYRQLQRIAEEGYELVHTQSPIGGVLCRLAFRRERKKGLRMIYQAHGFHFYRGASLVSWLTFYPIEKLCARFTDVLITINREDFARARDHFHPGRVEYVPGVGITLPRERPGEEACREKRRELGIPENALWLLAVGELNEGKNHRCLIAAAAQRPNVVLTIAGSGAQEEALRRQAQELGIEDRVRLLGYRTDCHQLYAAADVFAMPSFREGLPAALMEAMSMGMPVMVSRIRGNVDLVDEGLGGALFDPADDGDVLGALDRVTGGDRKAMGRHNEEKVRGFSRDVVRERMREIYEC